MWPAAAAAAAAGGRTAGQIPGGGALAAFVTVG